MKTPLLFAGLALLACTSNLRAQESQPTPDDTAAIRERIEQYVAAYNKHDAEGLAALWAEDAVYLNRDSGEEITGRPAIAAMFGDMFASGEAAELGVTVGSIRLITPDVAIEDGTAEITSADGEPVKSTYTAIHVKKDGNWFLTSVRETNAPPAAEAEDAGELAQLAWMVGDWIDQDEAATIRTHCEWARGRHFLTSSFEVNVEDRVELEGTQVIGWDPAAGVIRSWIFDSDGGFGTGVWRREGDQWIVDTTSTLSDGSQGSATNVYTLVDDQSFRWKSMDRQVNGEPDEQVAEVTVRRE
ncbi:MAG: SgcJ/EcaC family oxidoreductase [Pirellulales bacterium]|nr:SgcJ/EcaC family oxidoreductase [Pirellulales bacterium]